MKYEKLRWVLSQLRWELGQASVIYSILNEVIFLLTSRHYYSFQNMSNEFLTVILNQAIYQ